VFSAVLAVGVVGCGALYKVLCAQFESVVLALGRVNAASE
jgi:hypothetical protein